MHQQCFGNNIFISVNNATKSNNIVYCVTGDRNICTENTYMGPLKKYYIILVIFPINKWKIK